MTGQALPIFFNMVAGEDYWCWGVLGCKLYAVHGAIVGTSSIWTMVVIGFDRWILPISWFYPQHWLTLFGLDLNLYYQTFVYRWNVIVKGFNGTKITAGKALGFISVCWIFAIGIEMLPFIGWGKYGLGKIWTIALPHLVWESSTSLIFLQRVSWSPAATNTWSRLPMFRPLSCSHSSLTTSYPLLLLSFSTHRYVFIQAQYW